MIKKLFGFLLVAISILTVSCEKETRTLDEIEDQLIQEFITKNNLDFEKDSTGFYYQVIDSGNTDLPILRYPDRVRIGQKTTSINKAVSYETSIYNPTPSDFVGYIRPIPWRETIRKVRKGGIIRILIPSYLAYGKDGQGTNIPGNAILDTRIEIADDSNLELYEDRLINRYLTEKNITAIKDPSGIYYQINAAGDSNFPTIDSEITIAYTGRFLSGTLFETRTSANPLTSKLSELIEGWQITLPKIGVGGKIKIIVPSRYAYGESGSEGGVIGPNTILEFDIELISKK
ncbi:FKBP-type peptidyl-prolyl cis-trans isomerase [Pedobacter glucosidilyticus]|uniref:FKBP-type peptidyl-prolyl cis-trans isomerase n=1 Tax=Pedobacter glucosidilyticus TaxID=1122941 RepID=UPI0026EA2075|nr:FKBP-type peptidyl-prolyl cis-trans isomerase [Pedobacter glucosidilyticus]